MVSDLIQLLIDEPIWILPMIGVGLLGYFLGRYFFRWLRRK